MNTLAYSILIEHITPDKVANFLRFEECVYVEVKQNEL
jgi:hypothetical protein